MKIVISIQLNNYSVATFELRWSAVTAIANYNYDDSFNFFPATRRRRRQTLQNTVFSLLLIEFVRISHICRIRKYAIPFRKFSWSIRLNYISSEEKCQRLSLMLFVENVHVVSSAVIIWQQNKSTKMYVKGFSICTRLYFWRRMCERRRRMKRE